MIAALSLVFALVTSGASPRVTPAPAPEPTGGEGWGETYLTGLPSVYVQVEEDADCVYTVIHVRGLDGQWVPIWAESTCTDVVPDEEEDW